MVTNILMAIMMVTVILIMKVKKVMLSNNNMRENLRLAGKVSKQKITFNREDRTIMLPVTICKLSRLPSTKLLRRQSLEGSLQNRQRLENFVNIQYKYKCTKFIQ